MWDEALPSGGTSGLEWAAEWQSLLRLGSLSLWVSKSALPLPSVLTSASQLLWPWQWVSALR